MGDHRGCGTISLTGAPDFAATWPRVRQLVAGFCDDASKVTPGDAREGRAVHFSGDVFPVVLGLMEAPLTAMSTVAFGLGELGLLRPSVVLGSPN